MVQSCNTIICCEFWAVQGHTSLATVKSKYLVLCSAIQQNEEVKFKCLSDPGTHYTEADKRSKKSSLKLKSKANNKGDHTTVEKPFAGVTTVLQQRSLFHSSEKPCGHPVSWFCFLQCVLLLLEGKSNIDPPSLLTHVSVTTSTHSHWLCSVSTNCIWVFSAFKPAIKIDTLQSNVALQRLINSPNLTRGMTSHFRIF